MTPAQLAKKLGVSRQAIFRALKDGRLSCVKVPSPFMSRTMSLISMEEVKRFKYSRSNKIRKSIYELQKSTGGGL